MSENIQKTLLALEDVSGTLGSFVLNKDGALLAMEMPSVFEASMFKDLGPRIERLAESFSALGDEIESCVVRFSDHLIFIKQFAKGGALCILTESTVNLPALKMAVNLAHRRLAGEIAAAQPLPTSNGHSVADAPSGVLAAPPPPEPAVAPEIAVAAEPAYRRPPRMYRGHLVVD